MDTIVSMSNCILKQSAYPYSFSSFQTFAPLTCETMHTNVGLYYKIAQRSTQLNQSLEFTLHKNHKPSDHHKKAVENIVSQANKRSINLDSGFTNSNRRFERVQRIDST
jgi:hypothetical protein